VDISIQYRHHLVPALAGCGGGVFNMMTRVTDVAYYAGAPLAVVR
jgi:hypothetical protein